MNSYVPDQIVTIFSTEETFPEAFPETTDEGNEWVEDTDNKLVEATNDQGHVYEIVRGDTPEAPDNVTDTEANDDMLWGGCSRSENESKYTGKGDNEWNNKRW
ncbi:hypothetical protein MMC14_005264 [Varicellaria rhodocarpa]|nr:hypothetical protein [Varicellaria rhodocarpa]